jgi:hypothetical protein
MNRKTIPPYRSLDSYLLKALPALTFWTLLILRSDGAFAQTANGTADTSSSIRAIHLIGFEGATKNTNGNLSIQDDVLRFAKDGKPSAQVTIASIQNVFLGEQSREVGGTPMTLGKAATPFGGGRVVSLFAHKKYDTLALQYVDPNGGLHGAVFQLNKGQGDVLKSRLLAKGAHVSGSENQSTKQSAAGSPNENQ